MRNEASITRNVRTEFGEYEMKYILLENSEDQDEIYKTYSYRVEQYQQSKDGGGKELFMYSESLPVFDDHNEAKYFLKLISDGLVFPETLLYHIDDWFCALT